MRRRNIAFQDSLAGLGRQVMADEFTAEESALAFVRDSKLAIEYGRLGDRASSSGKAALAALLAAKGKARDEFSARVLLKQFGKDARVDEGTVQEMAGRASELVEAAKPLVHAILDDEIRADGTPNPTAITRNRALKEKLSEPEVVLFLAQRAGAVAPEKLAAMQAEIKAELTKAKTTEEVLKHLEQRLG